MCSGAQMARPVTPFRRPQSTPSVEGRMSITSLEATTKPPGGMPWKRRQSCTRRRSRGVLQTEDEETRPEAEGEEAPPVALSPTELRADQAFPQTLFVGERCPTQKKEE